MCFGRSVTICKSINKCSGSHWTITLHHVSNIAYLSVVNYEKFLVYIYKLQPVKFAKMTSLFRVRTGWGVLVRSQYLIGPRKNEFLMAAGFMVHLYISLHRFIQIFRGE